MVINLPEEYIIQKYFQYVGSPKYNKYNKTYQGSCPICREGTSWLKKRRSFFIPKNNNIYCHNCGWSGSPYKWIREVTKLTYAEIKAELNEQSYSANFNIDKSESKPVNVEALPKDCINLFDKQQLEFYKTNKIVKISLKFLEKRNLFNAINKPRAFFISLTDFIHKNRAVIPFYNENGKIIWYQTRLIDGIETFSKERYISKINSEKSLFNINQINKDLDKIFIFEGPLNACFVKNGIAVAGIQEKSDILYTHKQSEQISNFPFYDKIWVLDSQWIDNASKLKSLKLIEQNQKIFIWPEKFGKTFKDFNDIAVALNQNEISIDFIVKNTYQGIKAKLLLNQIK